MSLITGLAGKSVEVESIKLTTACVGNRYVAATGTYPGAGQPVLGILRNDGANGELVAVTVLGTEVVESGAAIPLFSPLETDALGRAVPLATGCFCGIALNSVAGAGKAVEVMQYPFGRLSSYPLMSFVAASAITAGQAIGFDNNPAGAGAAASGVAILGISPYAVAAGATGVLQLSGPANGILLAAQNVVAGDSLKTTAGGKFIKCAFTSGLTEFAQARAMVASNVGADAVIRVMILPGAARTVTA